MPDTHAPFHDKRAFSVMLKIAKDFDPHEVIILGDFFDCYSISDYTQDPTKAFNRLEEELVQAREPLNELVRTITPSKWVFIQGNHEFRVDRYINTYASKLGGMFSVRSILGIPKAFEWVPWGPKNFYKAGKLIVTHGTLHNKHVAAAMSAKYGTSVLFGHTHRIQESTTRNVHGDRIKGVTIGWLGDLERAAEYITNVADWSHGFAVSYHKPGGEYFLQTIEIEKYEAVFNGKLYL